MDVRVTLTRRCPSACYDGNLVIYLEHSLLFSGVDRARYEQRTRQSKVERKRAEKLAGGSLGRSFSRSFTGGLSLGQDRDDALLFGKSCDNGTLSKSKMRVSLTFALTCFELHCSQRNQLIGFGQKQIITD